MRTPRPTLITRTDQLSALASPVRQEIVDVLSRMGASALVDIAGVLGRPADRLYYHVRVLLGVGILVPAGSRNRAGREEALFRTAAPELALRYAPSSHGQDRAVVAIIASMMRLGIRDFRRAFASGGARVEGPRRELWALRTTGWLTPSGVAGLNRQIHGIKRALSGPRAKGRLYGITILLTPLEHRPRKSLGRPARPRRRQST